MKIFLFLLCCGLASQAFLGNVSASFTGANGTDTERARVKRVIEVDDEYYITHKNELKNVALHKPAVQSSTYYILRANLAVDGNTNPKVSAGSCTYTNRNSGVREWWAVDLGQMYRIYFIDITPQWDECLICRQRFHDFTVDFYDGNPRTPSITKKTNCYYHAGPLISPSTVSTQCHNGPANGRWVQIMNNPTNHLTLCEVQIYGIAISYQDYHGMELRWFPIHRDYVEANQSCNVHGGRLASPSNHQEYNVIRQFIKSIPELRGDYEVWLGGDDIIKEGDFRWYDGSKISPSYFKAGEPNNRREIMGCVGAVRLSSKYVYGKSRKVNVGENCVAMYSYDTILNDACCAQRKTYVCQKN